MRHWKSVAVAGAWLAAAGCGGGGSDARTERSQTMGGEVATADEARPLGEDELGGYVETETWEMTTSSPRGRDSMASGVPGEPYGGPEAPPQYGRAGTSEEHGPAGSADLDQPGMAQRSPGAGMGEPGMGIDEPGMGIDEPGMGIGEPGTSERTLARDALCPADIEGLDARVATIPGGGALVLTATGEQQVDELRSRLERFAEMHRDQRGKPGAAAPQRGSVGEPEATGEHVGTGEHGALGEPGATGEPGAMDEGYGLGSAEQPRFIDESALIHRASELRVVEIPNGARLEVTMGDQTQVQELRAELREDAAMLREGLCPLALQLER